MYRAKRLWVSKVQNGVQYLPNRHFLHHDQFGNRAFGIVVVGWFRAQLLDLRLGNNGTKSVRVYDIDHAN